MVWLMGLYGLNTVLLFIIAIREVRRPSHAVMWLLVGLILPVVGFVLYAIMTKRLRTFPRRTLVNPYQEASVLPDSFSKAAQSIARATHHLSVGGLRRGGIQIMKNGLTTYEQLFSSLRQAKRTIDIEYYIYRDDVIGKAMTDLIIQKAQEGVKVRFMKDGIGSWQYPRSEIRRLQAAGVHCRTTYPFRFPWLTSTINYRNHCKIVVIDQREAFIGGTNIGDEYTGLKPGVGYWRDTDVRIMGEAVVDYMAIFDEHWAISTRERVRRQGGKRLSPSIQVTSRPPLFNAEKVTGMMEWGAEPGAYSRSENHLKIKSEPRFRAYVQTFEGNPAISTQVMRHISYCCLSGAERSIDLTTPYFLPGDDLIMALKVAAARGVRVRLLVPLHVDHKIVGLASQTYFGSLLEAGVYIYMYNKGVLHPKTIVIDGEVSEVGAPNIDIRSFRLNYEVSGLFYSKDVAEQLTEQFERDLIDAIPLHIDDVQQRTIPQRIIEQTARIFSPLL